MVSRVYAESGYHPDQEEHAIPRTLDRADTITLGAFHGDTLVGTISLVIDGPQGLPMDYIYSEELTPLRASQLRIAEVGQFAIDSETYRASTGRAVPRFLALAFFGAALSGAIAHECAYICVAVNPKHARFYRLLGFRKIGEEKRYGAVSAPAIALVFRTEDWQRQSTLLGLLGREVEKHLLPQEFFFSATTRPSQTLSTARVELATTQDTAARLPQTTP